jgi:hypothetical protein
MLFSLLYMVLLAVFRLAPAGDQRDREVEILVLCLKGTQTVDNVAEQAFPSVLPSPQKEFAGAVRVALSRSSQADPRVQGRGMIEYLHPTGQIATRFALTTGAS